MVVDTPSTTQSGLISPRTLSNPSFYISTMDESVVCGMSRQWKFLDCDIARCALTFTYR
jgi:hypothetical protein